MAQLEISSPQAESNLVAASSRFSRLGDNPDVAGILLGAWHTFTTTVVQGVTTNIAKTSTISSWRYDGPMIDWAFTLNITGAGTAGSDVFLTLPIAALVPDFETIGMCSIYDSSAGTRYVCVAETQTSTLIGFPHDTSGASYWGVGPSIALANGDSIRGSVRYRWA
jgi:hypothetical protein